jgi:hypothetical protein
LEPSAFILPFILVPAKDHHRQQGSLHVSG